MALADIESQLNQAAPVPHKTCAVCHHMAERGDEWAEGLRRMLRNKGIRVKDLALALEEDPDEPTIPVAALARHARRGCAARESLR